MAQPWTPLSGARIRSSGGQAGGPTGLALSIRRGCSKSSMIGVATTRKQSQRFASRAEEVQAMEQTGGPGDQPSATRDPLYGTNSRLSVRAIEPGELEKVLTGDEKSFVRSWTKV